MDFLLRKVAEVPQADLDQFTCGDEDLDCFLKMEAVNFATHGITNTSVAFVDGFAAPAAFISISADSIQLGAFERGEMGLPFECNFSSFPAIKITKLATHRDLQSRGIGAKLLQFFEALVYTSPAAARLLTVNAVYRDRTVQFYRRAGFIMSVDAERQIEAAKKYAAEVATDAAAADARAIEQGNRNRRRPQRRGAGNAIVEFPSTVLMLRDLFIGAADTFPTISPDAEAELVDQPPPDA